MVGVRAATESRHGPGRHPITAVPKLASLRFTYALAPWAEQRKIRRQLRLPGNRRYAAGPTWSGSTREAGMPTLAPAKMLNADQIADAVMELISDDSIAGRALEIRPSGRRLVESRACPALADSGFSRSA